MRGLHLAALLLVVSALALVPPVPAGTAEAPELSDPAGDQAVQRTLPVVPGVNDDTFADVDIRAAWLSTAPGPATVEGQATNLTVTVRFAAPWRDTSRLTLALRTDPGPTSMHGTRSVGSVYNATVTGLTPAGNASAAQRTANDLVVTFVADPFGAFNPVGGDLVTITNLSASRSNAGNLPVAEDDSSGRDVTAGATAFTMPRPPPVAGVRLDALGGTIRSQPPRSFAGAQATVADAVTAVDFRVRLTNTGTDADNFTYGFVRPSKDASDAQPAIAQVPIPLAPGESHERTVTLRLWSNPAASRPDGDTFVGNVSVTSARGANTTLPLTIVLDLPEVAPPPPSPKPAPRAPVPAKLDFLSPAATALGLDGPFDEYAEAALLALLVLIAILTVFLALMLGASVVAIAPGSEAPPLARHDEPAPFVGTGALTAAEADADMAALAAAAAAKGRPAAAPPAPFVPVREQPALSIESVAHDPPEPEAGQDVQTTVVLRNEAAPSQQVRVALTVGDAQAAAEQAVVPGRSTRAVRLEWTAGSGDNRVRVQVFPV